MLDLPPFVTLLFFRQTLQKNSENLPTSKKDIEKKQKQEDQR